MPKSKKDKQGAARFETYYALQHIVPDSEWPTFLKTLATPLPITFRITDATHDGHAAWLEAEAARLGATRLPWYACGASTADVRGRVAPPPAARDAARDALRDFLVSGTTSRNLSRQEAVSMVPALLLGAAPGWAVLDACAARQQDRAAPGALRPRRLVVANDLSKKRSYALACHCAARLGVRCSARRRGLETRALAGAGRPLRRRALRRALLRRRHDPQGARARGLGLRRRRQAPRDAGRDRAGAARRLRPGGRVYSTCSLNPVENEAVVAEVLRLEPTLELAAAASPLPARPG
ncbi:tRNA (cytosine-5-)-methyltransferase [Aureococcus anophagefferens]|nr:tRNA (cytosine-5-)-methyltransferase [Aureococcus anophagefferens]